MFERSRKYVRRFQRDRRGASAVEYALLAVGVGVTVMAMINFLSTQIVKVQNDVVQAIQNKDGT